MILRFFWFIHHFSCKLGGGSLSASVIWALHAFQRYGAYRDVGPPGPPIQPKARACLRAELAGAMKTTMYREAAEAPDCVENQLQRNAATLATLADRLRAHPPSRNGDDRARQLRSCRDLCPLSGRNPAGHFDVLAFAVDILGFQSAALARATCSASRYRSRAAARTCSRLPAPRGIRERSWSPWSTIRTRRWPRSPRSYCRRAPAPRRARRRPRASSPRFRRSRRWWRCGRAMRQCRRR